LSANSSRDGAAAQTVEEVIGSRVVADRDHQVGERAQGQRGPGRIVLQHTGGETLPGVADAQPLVPASPTIGDRLAECAEDVELERRAERPGPVGVDAVQDTAATAGSDLGSREADLRRERVQLSVQPWP
jgi:hypothetical protein